MRFRRLDLLAFGHFTQVAVELPPGEPDIHFVFGPNEAGKSTALAAIEDVLFGIQPSTRHGFLHGLSAMRIGALLEGGAGTLEIRRRKGNKDTLLDGDGLPLAGAEAALASRLGGAERALFVRMFCLDHERLRRGGREILDAQDDVGQILFSAGAGVAGLRDRLRALHDEADALWGGRKASHRKYFQAEDRLKAADAAIRANSVTAARWNELKTAYDAAQETYGTLEREIEQREAEARKLGRIRRVVRDVRKHAEVTVRIAELRDAIALPADASAQAGRAVDDETHARTRLKTLDESIDALREERSRLTYDDALLGRSDDIKGLHEQRIHVRREKSDLPKRRAELAATENDLKRLQSELGWKIGDVGEIIAKLPARSKLANARALSKRRGELAAAVDGARAASEEAGERVGQLAREIAELGKPADLAGLTAALATARDAGDLGSRIAAAEREARAAGAAVGPVLAAMKPQVPANVELATTRVPSVDVVEHHRDRGRELDACVRACADGIRGTELTLERHGKEYARTEGDDRAVPIEDLQRLRAHRETGWSMIRLKYIEGDIVAAAEIEAYALGGSLTEAYRTAVDGADNAADRRFETAQATARLSEIARQISEQQEHLEELRGLERGYRSDEETFSREWLQIWKEVPLVPASPDEMLVWLAARAHVLLSAERRKTAEREAAFLRDEESQTKNLLVGEMAKLGADAAQLAARPFRAVLESAADLVRKHEGDAAARRKLEDARNTADTEVARKGKALETAQTELSGWMDDWNSAVTLLGLDPADAVETLEAQIEAIGEMREVGNRIQDLRRERIGKIERDIAAFETEVAATVASVGADLAGIEAEEAVIELERRLEEADRLRRSASDLNARLAAERKKVEDCDRARREAAEAIERLQQDAGASSVDELRAAIARSDEVRLLRTEAAALQTSLTQAGDGKLLVELTEECAGADLDQTSAREQTVSQELTDLRKRLAELGEARTSTRREFEAIGASATAAGAAADRQAALSDMKDIAEQYVRVRAAELLLQSTVDRYRREKQGPLLKRAGELFATLTDGSFKGLQVDYDDDKPQLAGLRDDGRSVPFVGMSAGSVDQLYLALRVAAVEDYLARSAPLPFVAEDLFVQFDDGRAAAGFKVLAELARKTQVLVFTHHAHHLEVAAGALGSDVSVVRLSQDAARLDVAKPMPQVRVA